MDENSIPKSLGLDNQGFDYTESEKDSSSLLD